MHEFWVILGITVLGLGLFDVFLAVLNYDKSGFLATRLCILQWSCLRSVNRRLVCYRLLFAAMILIFGAVLEQYAVQLLDVIFGRSCAIKALENHVHRVGTARHFLLVTAGEGMSLQSGK